VKAGYVRTSKKDQNPELQRRDLMASGREKIFEERISSCKEDRPELRTAIGCCREGDEFVLWKVDRFGRSLKELVELAGRLR
jgi:DNA invertase Pin-like site-specific DNA recombinase